MNADTEALHEQLLRYIEAMSDPTRSMILLELEEAGELTATQLAERLGLTANNVYHHMRVLRKLGVVPPPRAVPGNTYVEKYYTLPKELRKAIRSDPEWLDRIQEAMDAEGHKAVLISMCLTAAEVLKQAARRYEMLDAETLEGVARTQQLVMVSVNRLTRDGLRKRLVKLREVFEEGEMSDSESDAAEDFVLMVALPRIDHSPDKG